MNKEKTGKNKTKLFDAINFLSELAEMSADKKELKQVAKAYDLLWDFVVKSN